MRLHSHILKHFISGVLLTLALGSGRLARAQFPAEHAEEACSRENLKNSAQVGGYTFQNYVNKEEGTACVQVIREGKVIFRRTNGNDGWFQVGQPANKSDKTPAIPNGVDLTGRGHPDMIVAAYSGGAHCCLSHYVLELEPQFKILAHLDAEDTWPAYFADLGHDGHYFYIAEDWTLAYWPSSFAGSPSAPIILRWVDEGTGGSYHLALDKMTRLAPSEQEQKEDLRSAQQYFADGEDPSGSGGFIWAPVMRLIYTGHPDLAWKFLDKAWPARFKKDKEDWIEQFCIGLKESPYWPDLAPLLNNAPPACVKAKPRRKSR
jgi:hypothetical protein